MFSTLFGKVFGKGKAEFKCRIGESNLEIPVQSDQTLLQAALNQGIAFPHNCRAGGCGECKCRLVTGKVKELTDKSYLLSGEEMRNNFILACQAKPRSDLVVEVKLCEGPSHPVVEVDGVVEQFGLLTHDIMHLTLRLDKAIEFSAGHYADVSLLDDLGNELVTRSYSFANCPELSGTSGSIEFYIREVSGGLFSGTLFRNARVGMRVKVRGPFGNFYLRKAAAPLLFIAGGSGMAPIMAMIKGELQDFSSKDRDLTIVFGARSQEDLYLLDEMEQVSKRWRGKFRFVPVLSAEPDSSSWSGMRGFIGDQLRSIVGPLLADHHAYLCGPPAMIDTCVEALRNEGVNESVIYFDKFGDSSLGKEIPQMGQFRTSAQMNREVDVATP